MISTCIPWFKLAAWLKPASWKRRSHDSQTQFGHEHRRLLMRNRRAFEKRRIDEPHAAQVSLAQVRAIETRAFQMGILQTAAIEDRLAEIDTGQVGVGEVELLERGLAKRQATQMRAHQQGFDEAQPKRRAGLEIGAGQLAAVKRRRGKLGAPPAGVVQIARLESASRPRQRTQRVCDSVAPKNDVSTIVQR